MIAKDVRGGSEDNFFRGDSEAWCQNALRDKNYSITSHLDMIWATRSEVVVNIHIERAGILRDRYHMLVWSVRTPECSPLQPDEE